MSVDERSIGRALDEVRALVAADGGELALDRIDGTTVRLRLTLADAECADCVMPRPFLERVALDLVRAIVPAVTAVVVDDPREPA